MITVVPADLRVILQFIQVKYSDNAFHCITAASLAVLNYIPSLFREKIKLIIDFTTFL